MRTGAPEAKGFVAGTEGEWYESSTIYQVSQSQNYWREKQSNRIICVIGVGLKKDKIKGLFGVPERNQYIYLQDFLGSGKSTFIQDTLEHQSSEEGANASSWFVSQVKVL